MFFFIVLPHVCIPKECILQLCMFSNFIKWNYTACLLLQLIFSLLILFRFIHVCFACNYNYFHFNLNPTVWIYQNVSIYCQWTVGLLLIFITNFPDRNFLTHLLGHIGIYKVCVCMNVCSMCICVHVCCVCVCICVYMWGGVLMYMYVHMYTWE